MRFARKTDIILIAALVLAAILSWTLFTDVLGKAGASAEIYYRTELVKKVDLTSGEEETFSIPQEPDVVFHLYGDGSIAFVRSDCPDKVCVNSGKLSLAGQQAACLPNLVYIKIVSDGEASDTPDLYI
jgi:hypothetical protein